MHVEWITDKLEENDFQSFRDLNIFGNRATLKAELEK